MPERGNPFKYMEQYSNERRKFDKKEPSLRLFLKEMERRGVKRPPVVQEVDPEVRPRKSRSI